MSGYNGSGRLFVDEPATALDMSPLVTTMITPDERRNVRRAGGELARAAGGAWLFINGRFTSGGERSTDTLVKNKLWGAYKYPTESNRRLNVLLNSPGGSLDSAYSTALYLAAYAKELHVYVPSRAKSASTLLAIGAHKTFLSPFAELGPLDTQIPDPRNPATTVSALDCYQSVDYVRDFGFKTITKVLPQLVEDTERRIPVTELLATATTFAIGVVQPVLSTITALDFGGWGRSLRIGERYASKLLDAKAKDGDVTRADEIASQLVYGYTHHRFPIDIHEARRIGLEVELMKPDVYKAAVKVLNACRNKSFVGFLSKKEAAKTVDKAHGRGKTREHQEDGAGEQDPPLAEAGMAEGWPD